MRGRRRLAGLWRFGAAFQGLDRTEEASRLLPDPVEYNQAERFLAQYGITKDELISRRGGSP